MNSEIISFFLERELLVSPEVVEIIKNDSEDLLNKLKEYIKNNEISDCFIDKIFLDNLNFETDTIKKDKHISESFDEFPIKITRKFKENNKKKEVSDFTGHYKNRFEIIKNMLRNKPDLQGAISINRLYNKQNRDQVSIIGIVFKKETTKNNNIILTLEDSTGYIKVIVTKNKEELFNKVQDISLDSVIGIKGSTGNNVIFCENIYLPGISINAKLKKGEENEYFAVISDVHVGSNFFLEKDFLKFVDWINGTVGSNEQKEIAKKLKYLFIVGDLVDGVGIYPNQENELNIQDIVKQYDKFAELINLIRKDIKIVICPGNHDAVRIAEPQPAIDIKISKSVWDLPNVTMVTNPAHINIGSTNSFEGFDVLMYHGYSFDYYINNIGIIRNNGGYDKPDLAMKYLLDKRHLAPTHGSTLIIPNPEEDALAITKVPDFFIMGHVHKPAINQHGKTTLICGSCWQSTTPFQEKVGHKPEPSKVQLVNLKTREIKVMKFGE